MFVFSKVCVCVEIPAKGLLSTLGEGTGRKKAVTAGLSCVSIFLFGVLFVCMVIYDFLFKGF